MGRRNLIFYIMQKWPSCVAYKFTISTYIEIHKRKLGERYFGLLDWWENFAILGGRYQDTKLKYLVLCPYIQTVSLTLKYFLKHSFHQNCFMKRNFIEKLQYNIITYFFSYKSISMDTLSNMLYWKLKKYKIFLTMLVYEKISW